MRKKKTILVAPLNWGLGHATRCIPIINLLLTHNFNVLIGSDGAPLRLLKKEFPTLKCIELPSYNITYPKKGEHFKLKLFLKLPTIRKAIASEKNIIKKLVRSGQIDGVISDNRLGVRNKQIPSVFITHQLNVLSGSTSYFSSKMHQQIIKKYDACWVPDTEKGISLSGKLGHPKKINFPVHYIGPLSRMTKEILPKKYDILALLSGPEPQRTLLEDKLIDVLGNSPKKVLLVRGVIEEEELTSVKKGIEVVNFLQSSSLEKAINESTLVISRSGYTTIMDLAAMEKDAFFIPTPGQYEQEYLAKQLKKQQLVPSCKQENFSLKKLEKVKNYKGLKSIANETNYKQLLSLFESE